MIRVVVVDDQPLVRAGIVMLVNAEDDITVIAEAADGAEALTQIRAHRPDVVLMDVRMPGTDGVAATRAVVDEKAFPNLCSGMNLYATCNKSGKLRDQAWQERDMGQVKSVGDAVINDRP